MLIDEGLDTGPAAARAHARDRTRRDGGRARAAARAARRRAAGRDARGPRARARSRRCPRTTARATLAPLLRKEDGRVDWTLPAHALACRARALLPVARCLHAARRPTAQADPRARACPSRGRSAGRGRRGVRPRGVSSSRAARTRACCSRRSSPRAARRCRRRPGQRGRGSSAAAGSAEDGIAGPPRSRSRSCGASSRGGTTLDTLDRLEARLADERDRAFLHELVLGTLRRRGWLDHAIARALRPAARASSSPRSSRSSASARYQLLRPARRPRSGGVGVGRARPRRTRRAPPASSTRSCAGWHAKVRRPSRTRGPIRSAG